jgi:hypothetical protein
MRLVLVVGKCYFKRITHDGMEHSSGIVTPPRGVWWQLRGERSQISPEVTLLIVNPSLAAEPPVLLLMQVPEYR